MAINRKIIAVASAIAIGIIGTAYAANTMEGSANIKELVATALRDGSSEGYLTGLAAKVFQGQSHSNEPIKMHITKIKNYQNGCGRLRFELEQGGIKDTSGKMQTITPWFEANLCKDGDPPLELVKETQEKERKMLEACKVTMKKGAIDKATGNQSGELIAQGCPAGGMSHWRYDGDCGAMQMPPNMVTNTPISKEGEIKIQMLIPAQCLPKNNVWTGQIVAGEPIGTIHSKW